MVLCRPGGGIEGAANEEEGDDDDEEDDDTEEDDSCGRGYAGGGPNYVGFLLQLAVQTQAVTDCTHWDGPTTFTFATAAISWRKHEKSASNGISGANVSDPSSF